MMVFQKLRHDLTRGFWSISSWTHTANRVKNTNVRTSPLCVWQRIMDTSPLLIHYVGCFRNLLCWSWLQRSTGSARVWLVTEVKIDYNEIILLDDFHKSFEILIVLAGWLLPLSNYALNLQKWLRLFSMYHSKKSKLSACIIVMFFLTHSII